MSTNPEPLRFLLHPVALLAFAAAAQAWIDGATVRGIVAAVLGVLIAGATEAARRRVKPIGKAPAAQERGYSRVEALLALLLIAVVILVLVIAGVDVSVGAVAKSWG